MPCKDGKLYIAPVFDCFCGEAISLAMDTNMKKELCISALEAAFEKRKAVQNEHNKNDGRTVRTVAFRYVMIYKTVDRILFQ